MKPKTKFVIASFFKSLFSNDAAIDGAKKAPWWMAVVMFVLSIGLPLIPLAVSGANTRGSDSFGKYALGTDRYLTEAAIPMKDNGISFNISNGECVLKVGDEVDHRTSDEKALTPLFTYEATRDLKVSKVNEDKSITTTDVHAETYEFNVYYTDRPFKTKKGSLEDSVSDLIAILDDTRYVQYTKTELSSADPEDTNYYIPSYAIIFTKGIYFSFYTQDSTIRYSYTSFGSTENWNHTKDCELLTRVLEVKNFEGTKSSNNNEYVAGVYKNWKVVVDELYKTTKSNGIRTSLLIYLGVYAVLVVLMGFMIWLLTRGKNNVFNYLNFWTTSKIAAWSALSPSILGMILGFLFTQYAPFIFIILLGIRVMWLSMKQLRPY